ncbi:MAG TPA: hypothetical protein ENJ98_07520 [Thiolapillus brandeum]|uniref:Ketopantoate reductase n=1 Tax=Thiolapillus brandeum TaxID=1076588 RepID=A0A7C5J034_9GAMM|nr:hypothetical protein [Thiolapillus brandeum]
MKQPVILIGVGEMGGVFARGFLRLGHPLYPVTRQTSMEEVASAVPDPEAVVVAVGEKDLRPVLETLPGPWRNRLVLLQNELLPADFAHLPEVTVISVWFEKKPGMDFKVILPSPVFGPRAQLVDDALATLEIPVKRLGNEGELLFELVLKNLYILTTNIAGLEAGGTVGELWREHRELAQAVAEEVIALQERLTGQTFDHQALIDAMLEAFEGDPNHRCTGRSAPARLERALEHGRREGIDLPTLAQIASEVH